MSYKNNDSRLEGTIKDGALDVKGRFYGMTKDEGDVSLGEMQVKAGLDGLGVIAEGNTHFFNFHDEKSKTAVKAFGVTNKAAAGLNWNALRDKGTILGYEIINKATLVDCKAGPLGLHIGIGCTQALNVSDKTVTIKVGGIGGKIGKRIGVSFMDTEFTFETLALVGKGWIWGSFD